MSTGTALKLEEEEIDLTVELRRSISTYGSESDYLGRYDASLIDVHTKAIAGKMRAYVLNLEQAELDGFDAEILLDTEAATYDYAQLLGKDEGNFSSAMMKILGEDHTFNRNMLIIDRVELLPAFRGFGLGLKCMQACITNLSMGCRIVAIKPFPLQLIPSDGNPSDWQQSLEFESLSRNASASLSKLKKHYAKLGFVHVRGSNLMVLDLS